MTQSFDLVRKVDPEFGALDEPNLFRFQVPLDIDPGQLASLQILAVDDDRVVQAVRLTFYGDD